MYKKGSLYRALIMAKPRYIYEVTSMDVSPTWDRQAAFVLVDTNGDLDFSLRVTRDTLVQLKHQVDHALSDQAQGVVPKKED
jgi:hypothetical protein